MTVGHLFFEYFDYLREVNLRWLHGSMLREHFQKWLDEYPDPYPQRYRKNIPYSIVKQNAILLMTLKEGEVIFPVLSTQSASTPNQAESEPAPPED